MLTNRILRHQPEKISGGWHKYQLNLREFAMGDNLLRAKIGSEIQVSKAVIAR
jgi:hypothetical protein